MDPNATLAALIDSMNVLGKLIDDESSDHPPAWVHVADGVFEHFNALNEWMRNGGFLPAEWMTHREGIK